MTQARLKIIERQNIIRSWWLQQATNPLLIKAFSASWSDPVHVERWMDMQARLACYEEGRLLADDTTWFIVENELRYVALWLMKNWSLTSVKKVSKKFLNRYYIIKQNKNGLYVPVAAPTVRANIAANPAELYEWLGVIGGDIILPPEEDEEE